MGTRSTCCPGHPAGHTHLTVLFVRVSFLTPPNRFMRIHSLSRVPTRVLASSIHSLADNSKAWLFIDSVFPVKFAAWESVIHSIPCPLDTHNYNTSFRYFFGHLRQERLLDTLSELISQVHTHGFKPIFIEPLVKDGGVFVHFEYIPSQSEDVLSNIQSDLRSHIQSQGGVPSSAGLRRGNIWIVQGQPWREVPFLSSFNLARPSNFIQDMNRFASPIIRVAFDGADLQEETLYHTFRVFCLSPRNNTPLIPTTSHMVALLTSQHQLPFLAPLTVLPPSLFLISAPLLWLAMSYTVSALTKHAFVPLLFLRYRDISSVTGLLSIPASLFRSSYFSWAP
jgi:hypothetical protein